MRRKRSRARESAFKWFYWHTVTKTLQARLRAIVRGRPYSVMLLQRNGETVGEPPAFCDFEKRKIGINPEAFAEVFLKKRGIPEAELDDANYQASRALLEHEAAHVRYSSAEICFRVGKYPLWHHITNLLEDVRVENVISSSSNVSKTLISLLCGIARELYKPTEKATEADPEYILHLILRWRIGMPELALTNPAAIERWGHVLPLCEEAKWAPTMARVAEIADEILTYLGIGRGKSMTEMQKEFEEELRKQLERFESQKQGRQSKPEKNPLKSPDGIPQKEAGTSKDTGGKKDDVSQKQKGRDAGDNDDRDSGSESSSRDGTDGADKSGGSSGDSEEGGTDDAPSGRKSDESGAQEGEQDEDDPGGRDSGEAQGSDPTGDSEGDSGHRDSSSREGSEGGSEGGPEFLEDGGGGSDSEGTGDTEDDDASDSPGCPGGTGEGEDGTSSGGDGADADGSGTAGDRGASGSDGAGGESGDSKTSGSNSPLSGDGACTGNSVTCNAAGEQAQDVPSGESGMEPSRDGASPQSDPVGDAEEDEPHARGRNRGSRSAGSGLGKVKQPKPLDLKELLGQARAVSGNTLEKVLPVVAEEDMVSYSDTASGGWGGSEEPIHAEPYEQYLEYAYPIAAEIKKQLRTDNPRAFDGPSMYGRRLKARYDIRDEERPFTRRQVVGRDMPTMALVLIIDRSSSLSTEMMEFEKIAAMGMVIACEDLRIPLAIHLVEGANELKRFDENGPQVLAKLAALRPVGGTETTPAINRTIAALKKRPEKMRQIVFFHDGEPNGACIPHFIASRQGLRGMSMFGIYVAPDGEEVEEGRPYLTGRLEELFGSRCFTICRASEVAKHWTTFIRGKRSALAR